MLNLKNLLTGLERKSYKAYRDLQGDYQFANFHLRMEHIQGDPYAEPSRCSVMLPMAAVELPEHLYHSPIRRIALEDYLGRRFSAAIKSLPGRRRGPGHGGEFKIASYGQQVLQRSSVLIRQNLLEVRFQIGLPAKNRRIDADRAQIMLISQLPGIVGTALLKSGIRLDRVEQHICCIEDQHFLREQLAENKLVAFVGDESNLARRSGEDDHGLVDGIRTRAPDSLAVELSLARGRKVRGLAFPAGISLIVGGGFHGKSTLLRAIEQGVYNHIPGDGRELVVSDPDCFKLRAEDGRSINGIDIRPFIQNLPLNKDCEFFTTNNASGSSSQAASIVEALSTGSKTLLIDEDTSATNFLIRDARMQSLVPKSHEPITPLLQRIIQLKDQLAVSVIMVIGGSGDYFSVADQVVMMDNYEIRDKTLEARKLASDRPDIEQKSAELRQRIARIPQQGCLSPLGENGKIRIKAFSTRLLQYGVEEVSLQSLEQLVDSAQVAAIGYLIDHLNRDEAFQETDLVINLKNVLDLLQQQGFDSITPYPLGNLALPRLLELVAVVNRMRLLKLQAPDTK